MASLGILVGKRQAASLLAVSVRTIENLIKSKELPARRIGRRVLIPRQSLIEFARRDHATQIGGKR
jgi:excisionase family DNA binding protein